MADEKLKKTPMKLFGVDQVVYKDDKSWSDGTSSSVFSSKKIKSSFEIYDALQSCPFPFISTDYFFMKTEQSVTNINQVPRYYKKMYKKALVKMWEKPFFTNFFGIVDGPSKNQVVLYSTDFCYTDGFIIKDNDFLQPYLAMLKCASIVCMDANNRHAILNEIISTTDISETILVISEDYVSSTTPHNTLVITRENVNSETIEKNQKFDYLIIDDVASFNARSCYCSKVLSLQVKKILLLFHTLSLTNYFQLSGCAKFKQLVPEINVFSRHNIIHVINDDDDNENEPLFKQERKISKKNVNKLEVHCLYVYDVNEKLEKLDSEYDSPLAMLEVFFFQFLIFNVKKRKENFLIGFFQSSLQIGTNIYTVFFLKKKSHCNIYIFLGTIGLCTFSIYCNSTKC